MRKTMVVRFLVPKERRNGRVEYHIETRNIRLPLKRGDRELLQKRLSS